MAFLHGDVSACDISPCDCTGNFGGKKSHVFIWYNLLAWLTPMDPCWLHLHCLQIWPQKPCRRCKVHWGCFSVLTSCIFILHQHGDRWVRSISHVSFPNPECLAVHDVPPKLGFSLGVPVERTPIGTFHFRNSWTAVGFFCTDFHESRTGSSPAGSQAAFVVTGNMRCLPMCHWLETLLPLTVIHTF